MGTTLCLRCWAYRTACSPSVVPMACWSSKYSAGMPSFEQTSRLSTRCGFSSVRIVSSGAIHQSKCRMMQACFALAPQDNAVRAFRFPRVGLLPPRRSYYGRFFLAFNGSQEIPISTFGHSNACCQSRRGDCGLSHACLRSSAVCAFCGILCVLDGFVLKCPKVETMNLDGVVIPGSVILVVHEVRFVAHRVRFCGARSPFWLRTASSCFACRGVTIKFACGGQRVNISVESEQKRRPEGRLACK